MLEDLLARKLVEVAPAALVVATAGGEIVSLNPFVEALFGVPRAEALGGALERIDDGVRRVLVLTSKGAEPPVAPAGAHVERLCAESLPPPRETHAQPLERRYLWARRRDGVERAVELQSGTLELEGAGFVFIALRDATEERQAIEALARSEERLQRAQRVAKLGSWEWNLRDQTVVRSAQTYAMYGIEPDMDTDRPLAFLSRVPAEERERVSRLLSDAVASGHAYTFEHRMVRPDGEVRVFLQQGVPERENGTVVRFVGTALDITDLRTAERERESALAELRAVLDQCPVGITIAHGPDAARVESNRAARALLGGPIDEGAGVGQFAGRLFAADGTPVAPEHLPARRVLRGERIEREELLLRRADGSLIPLELDAAPVRDADGVITGAVAVWVDLRGAKELERLRVEWNSVVAHDLMQPLNGIALYAQLLAGGAVDDVDSMRSVAGKIRQLVARLTRMTRDLRDLSRLDARRLSLVRAQVDVVALARDAIERCALEAPDRAFELVADEALPTVEADADRLSQVLENLLTNAVKYGRADRPVRVAIGRVERALSVAIVNEGPGIAAAELDRIFGRFERVGLPVHRGVPGLGLGLQIAQGLVEAHGGRLEVESVAGETTTFRFTLPITG